MFGVNAKNMKWTTVDMTLGRHCNYTNDRSWIEKEIISWVILLLAYGLCHISLIQQRVSIQPAEKCR